VRTAARNGSRSPLPGWRSSKRRGPRGTPTADCFSRGRNMRKSCDSMTGGAPRRQIVFQRRWSGARTGPGAPRFPGGTVAKPFAGRSWVTLAASCHGGVMATQLEEVALAGASLHRAATLTPQARRLVEGPVLTTLLRLAAPTVALMLLQA